MNGWMGRNAAAHLLSVQSFVSLFPHCHLVLLIINNGNQCCKCHHNCCAHLAHHKGYGRMLPLLLNNFRFFFLARRLCDGRSHANNQNVNKCHHKHCVTVVMDGKAKQPKICGTLFCHSSLFLYDVKPGSQHSLLCVPFRLCLIVFWLTSICACLLAHIHTHTPSSPSPSFAAVIIFLEMPATLPFVTFCSRFGRSSIYCCRVGRHQLFCLLSFCGHLMMARQSRTVVAIKRCGWRAG